jgi:eukaryotic-like serine/threonine-protein kinase
MRVGDIIDHRFHIIRLIGNGGMGDVYEATDLEQGIPVALKIAHGSDKSSVQRFLREAVTLSKLRHRGIVRYIAHGVVADKMPYLAMEWLDGEDLGKRLARGPLSVSETLAVGLQAAEALRAAHSRGVLHLDIKPSNLFLVDKRIARLKLLDFGLARVATPNEGFLPGIADDRCFGSWGFISPEQARGERDLDERADLHSLGTVLFSCLTQKPPLLLSHIVGAQAEVLFEVVPRASELRGDVPPALDALIARLMHRDPARRLPSAMALIEALEGLADELDGARTSPLAPAESPPSSQRYWSVLVIGRDDCVIDSSRLLVMARQHNLKLMPSATDSVAAAMYYTDQDLPKAVTHVVCSAMEMRSRFPKLPLAMATGRIQPGAPIPVASVIEQADVRWLDHDGSESLARMLPGRALKRRGSRVEGLTRKIVRVGSFPPA